MSNTIGIKAILRHERSGTGIFFKVTKIIGAINLFVERDSKEEEVFVGDRLNKKEAASLVERYLVTVVE